MLFGFSVEVKSRIRHFIWMSFISLFSITMVIGCAEQKDVSTEMRIALESEPERLDPMTIKNPKTFILTWQIFEGLLGLDEHGNIIPVLAESWDTEDYQTWTFHLRKNARFHSSKLFGGSNESRDVTAEDVHWSYTAYCSSGAYLSFLLTDSVKGCAEYNAGKVESVSGYKIIDSHTFQVNLVKPEPFFLNRLTTAWVAIFPKESAEEQFRDSWGLQVVVGTGPYRLKSQSASEVMLTANAEYWDKDRVPSVKQLRYRVITNDQVRLAEFEKGNIDLMFVPSQLFPTILYPDGRLKEKYADRGRVKTVELFNSNQIGINLNNVPDAHLRRAMSFGTDRKTMVQKILYGYGDITSGPTPPGMNGYKPVLNPNTLYDIEKAKNELSKSSYNGEELEMFVHELANSEQIGQIFQSQMKDLGINIKLTKLDFNSAIGRMIKGDAPLFSMFADIVFSSPEPILINLFSSGKRPVPNFWQYSNAEVDAQLEGLREIEDRAESVKRAAEVEAMIMEDVPAIFLYRQKPVVLHATQFGDLEINSHGHFSFEKLAPRE